MPRTRPRARRRVGLLTRFGVTSFVLLAAVGVAVGFRLAEVQRERALADATAAAEVVVQTGILPLLDEGDLTRSFVPLDGERRDALDAVLQRSVDGEDVVRLKIWNRERWIVYSDNPRLLGRWFAGEEALDAAFAGETTSFVTDLSAPEELEERDFGRLLAVYTPLRIDAGGQLTSDATGEVVGAFEIYLPYAPVAAAITDDTRQLVVALAIGLVVVYLGLFRLVAGASRRLRIQAAENEHLATHDLLTGLPNRVSLGRHAEALRQDGVPTAIAVIGLDGFAVVNNTLGHPAGDEILRTLAARFDALAPHTWIARLGGDQFAAVLPGVDSEVVAVAEVERVLTVLDAPIEVGGIDITVRASAGIALRPGDDDDRRTDRLVQQADVAMQVAKAAGGGVRCYEATLDHHSTERLALAADIRRAVGADDELFLVYQPKVDIVSGRLVGVEALVRWRHTVHGVVPPDRFLPVVESSDLIGPFTERVLDLAVAQHAAWAALGHVVPVAVNVSARNVADPTFPAAVHAALGRHGVEPDMLELELTESAVLADPDRAAAALHALHDAGIHLAVDDFGTGHASIGYLTSLPVDVLKIDRSFVQHVEVDERSHAIVRFTVALAEQLGMRVVGEGVEDQGCLDVLGQLGCDIAQGYHLSRPLPADELLAWHLARTAPLEAAT